MRCITCSFFVIEVKHFKCEFLPWNIIGKPMGYDIPYEVLIDNRGKSKAYGRQNLLNAMGEDFPIDVIEAERKVLNEQMFLEAKNIVKPGVKELLAWMKEHQILSGIAFFGASYCIVERKCEKTGTAHLTERDRIFNKQVKTHRLQCTAPSATQLARAVRPRGSTPGPGRIARHPCP